MKSKDDFQEEFKGKESDETYVAPKRTFTPDDEAIHEILVNVLAKWRAARASEHDEWKETVVLSSGKSAPKAASLPLKGEKNVLPETVIISASGARARPVKPSMPPSLNNVRSLDQTVTIEVGKKEPPLKKDIKKSHGLDLLTETVILPPKKEKDKKKDGE